MTIDTDASPSRDSPAEETLDTLVVVLDEVRFGHSRSRSEIAHRTGLSRAVVTQRVTELVDRGLLREAGPGPSTGGRRPRQLGFVASAGHLLVADLGATSIDVALTDLTGRILDHRAEPADISHGPEAVLGRVDQLFGRLHAAESSTGHLWGIGIGVPGPVEFRTGKPTSPPIMPGWDGYPIRERFAERYGAPVWTDNDVNVMALGEWRAGVARGHSNVVFVKVGTGIGAGLISDGLLHRGAQGAAGDVGHIQVVDDPAVVCRCGNIGCLEAIAGGGALARDGTKAAQDGRSALLAEALRSRGSVTAADIALAAQHGDRASVELLQEAGRRIGTMLASVVNFFNPSLIVVGGGVAASGDQLVTAIREVVYRRSLPLATRELLIKRSALPGIGGVIGAGAMVADQLLARPVLERWIGAGSPVGQAWVAADSVEPDFLRPTAAAAISPAGFGVAG
jgi:glucokinase-like ROK family protein